MYSESLQINRESQNKFGISSNLLQLGNLLVSDRDYDGARVFLEECVEFNRENNDSRGEGFALKTLLRVANIEGDEKFARLIREDLKRAQMKSKD